MGVHFYEGIWSWYRFVKAVWGWVSIFENEIQIGMDTNLGGGGCLYQNFRISRLTPTGFVWKMHTPPDLTLVYDDLKPKGCLWYVFHILKKNVCALLRLFKKRLNNKTEWGTSLSPEVDGCWFKADSLAKSTFSTVVSLCSSCPSREAQSWMMTSKGRQTRITSTLECQIRVLGGTQSVAWHCRETCLFGT